VSSTTRLDRTRCAFHSAPQARFWGKVGNDRVAKQPQPQVQNPIARTKKADKCGASMARCAYRHVDAQRATITRFKKRSTQKKARLETRDLD
jgi:hypothetical protein